LPLLGLGRRTKFFFRDRPHRLNSFPGEAVGWGWGGRRDFLLFLQRGGLGGETGLEKKKKTRGAGTVRTGQILLKPKGGRGSF